MVRAARKTVKADRRIAAECKVPDARAKAAHSKVRAAVAAPAVGLAAEAVPAVLAEAQAVEAAHNYFFSY